jgi:hypothetical protein
VPEATIHEYCHPASDEDDIGAHAQAGDDELVIDPEAQPVSMEKRAQLQLWTSIALTIRAHGSRYGC